MSLPIDPLDEAMLNILREDARLSNREVARRLGVPEGRVRLRLKKLQDAKCIRFTLLMSTKTAGLDYVVYLRLIVDPLHLDSVAELLSTSDRVAFIGFMSGSYNLLVVLLSSSPTEIFDFLNADWVRNHGVQATKVNLVVTSPKHRSDLIRTAD